MLVLTRKQDESIYLIKDGEILGEVILSKIVSLNAVNIGLEFGNDIQILRKEVLHGKQDPNSQRMVQDYIAKQSQKLPNMQNKTRPR